MQCRPLVVEDVVELASARRMAEVLRRAPVPLGDGVDTGAPRDDAHRAAEDAERRQSERQDLAPPPRRLEDEPRCERHDDGYGERRVGEDREPVAQTGGDEPPGARVRRERAERQQTAGSEQPAAKRVVAQAVDVEWHERDCRHRCEQGRRCTLQHAPQPDEHGRGHEQREQELQVPHEQHDAVHADEFAPDPHERGDEQGRLLRHRRLVDERARALGEPPRQHVVERLVGQIDAVPAPPVGDSDDRDRGGDCDHPRGRQPPPRAVRRAAPTREEERRSARAPVAPRPTPLRPGSFSRIAIGERAVTAVPSSACTSCRPPWSGRYRMPSRRAWRSVVFDIEMISRKCCCPGNRLSLSSFFAAHSPSSPAATLTTR